MQVPGWDKETSPYHGGEQILQERVGRKERQEQFARRIHRTFMPDQHRSFFNQLPFLVVGSIDSSGWPWASLLFGRPGFITTPDDKTLRIDARPLAGDPLAGNTADGAPLGLLGIELPTRRRNRVNGVASGQAAGTLNVSVVQSYGNCPQYIQTREAVFVRDPKAVVDTRHETFTTLGDDIVALIGNADTFFVASYNDRDDKHDTGGADVSHRGGRPGFVKVDGNTLTIPDFVGNFAFNTFGNFLVNPKAGLLFVDFEGGDIWQLTGNVELIWNMTDELEAFRGAERGWRFHLDHGVRLKSAAPLSWRTGEVSPNAKLTGDWGEAARVRSSSG